MDAAPNGLEAGCALVEVVANGLDAGCVVDKVPNGDGLLPVCPTEENGSEADVVVPNAPADLKPVDPNAPPDVLDCPNALVAVVFPNPELPNPEPPNPVELGVFPNDDFPNPDEPKPDEPPV